jgi:hypothetical protein
MNRRDWGDLQITASILPLHPRCPRLHIFKGV